MRYELKEVTSWPRLSRSTLTDILLSIAYALFVVAFPWEEISRAGFTDFTQYVDYFDYFLNKNDISFDEVYNLSADTSQLSALKEYFTHEVIWFELVRRLSGMTGDVAMALHIISFFILFVWGLYLFQRVNYALALLFLFNPFAIDVAMSGIRNGLAWSLVMLGLMTRSKALRAALLLTGMFIHSATLVLVIFYYFTKVASKFVERKTLLLSGLGIGVLVGLMLTVGNELVLGAIGDRRQGEDYLVGGGSFSQASLWGVLLYLQCISGRTYIRQNLFVIAVIAWYLTMNPFIPWSYRIWGALLPIIATSAMNLSPRSRQVFVYLYAGYVGFQYLYWTKLFYYWSPA